jgi:polynucleotide 5'-kinase involved in rRNA processing
VPEPMRELRIVVRGCHDSGKTTVANLVRMALEEGGFRDVRVLDVPPLPPGQKDDFPARLARNLGRPVRIVVELEEDRHG